MLDVDAMDDDRARYRAEQSAILLRETQRLIQGGGPDMRRSFKPNTDSLTVLPSSAAKPDEMHEQRLRPTVRPGSTDVSPVTLVSQPTTAININIGAPPQPTNDLRSEGQPSNPVLSDISLDSSSDNFHPNKAPTIYQKVVT